MAAENPPALNPVIEGTVRFGSFNYTGDKGTDAAGDERDGVQTVLNTLFRTLLSSLEALFRNVTAW